MNGKSPLVDMRLDNKRGFTLIELAIIIVVLGILATFVAANYGDFIKQSKVNATKSELQELKRAIIGNPRITGGGKYTDIGYEGHLGAPPSKLNDLVTKPSGVPDYNKISGLGWNGPYIDGSNDEYLTDAWGKNYVYDPQARTIKSVGSGEDITVSF